MYISLYISDGRGMSHVFRWRPRIGIVLNWFRHGWFALSGATIWVALAFVVFTWFQPSLAQWSLEGIILMLLRNLFLIFIIAGGLHLWLWAMRFQGDRLKFDIRDMMRDNGTFTFRNQVFDNMFWSIAWGVPIWTLYEVIYFPFSPDHRGRSPPSQNAQIRHEESGQLHIVLGLG